jgi:hypothetical protein
LNGVVSGNTGNGTAKVANGGLYTGLSSSNIVGGFNTVVTMLGGTNSSGVTQTVAMQFGNPDSLVSPDHLGSDIIKLTGTDQGSGPQTYVLDMTYSPAAVNPTEPTFIAWFNGSNWQNAGSIYVGNVAWNSSDTTLGDWGYYNGDAWVVTNNVGSFAVVPEPGTLALLAGGLLSLIAYAWRKRK